MSQAENILDMLKAKQGDEENPDPDDIKASLLSNIVLVSPNDIRTELLILYGPEVAEDFENLYLFNVRPNNYDKLLLFFAGREDIVSKECKKRLEDMQNDSKTGA